MEFVFIDWLSTDKAVPVGREAERVRRGLGYAARCAAAINNVERPVDIVRVRVAFIRQVRALSGSAQRSNGSAARPASPVCQEYNRRGNHPAPRALSAATPVRQPSDHGIDTF